MASKHFNGKLSKSSWMESGLLSLPECPVFRPSAKEFANPIKYISSIRHIGEKYGIIKIIPPKEFKFSHTIQKSSFRFKTKVQPIHLLQNRGKKLLGRKRKSENTLIRDNKRPKLDEEAEELAEFGYLEGKEFSLNSFSRMAKKFKLDFFKKRIRENKDENIKISRILQRKLARKGGLVRLRRKTYYDSVDEVDEADIENEYWRVIEDANEDVIVHYGSDVDCSYEGSGFPKYWDSGWHMEKLPVLKDSLLHYVYQKTAGINSPMMYVGMLFSSFCWHTEDNYLFSINYIHYGDSKTWYGVPASAARKFERVMRQELPEIFEMRPDTLYLLVTQLSPFTLKKHGVPVYRMTHYAGEYMITFPQAYHAGLNNGYNCAESVNFACPSWLAYGRLAADDYYLHHRTSAFSHDQLVYTACLNYQNISPDVVRILRVDLEHIRNFQFKHQQSVIQSGTRFVIMDRPNKRQNCRRARQQKDNDLCLECKQDCYLSVVTCDCTKKKACVTHANLLCDCHPSRRQLHIRYTIKEIDELIEKMKKRELEPEESSESDEEE